MSCIVGEDDLLGGGVEEAGNGLLRALAVLVSGTPAVRRQSAESRNQIALLGLAALCLLLLGLIPQLLEPFLSTLPRMFEHLASQMRML